jgi:dienelactone hydrolase
MLYQLHPNSTLWLLPALVVCLLVSPLAAQSTTWDKYFEREVARLEANNEADLAAVTQANWDEKKTQWRVELFEMLGLSPLPVKTDLQTTVTGSLHHAGLTIQRLHYQSRPGLYVTANLYLPSGEPPEQGWPAVLYVCGHANIEDAGRKLGNKIGYQQHGLWFARHGVACLMIDTVQLGELHGEHHGTYKLGRWDWISRGYTPAGVEAWNAIRGIDLLESWPGIDGSRIGITGRSGGGAYSWYAAALDDRIKVAVPVAGITDLRNHVLDGCVEGHCDCMYMINYYGWDYSKLAALIAPRPLLLANSDSDSIFPLDGVIRTHRTLAKLYATLGASNNYGVLITPGPHKDTQELQVGAFRWLLRTLLGQETVVSDAALKELDPSELAVFERETPADERVAAVGNWFVQNPKTVSDEQQAAQLFAASWLPQLRKTALSLPLATLAEAPHFDTSQLRESNSSDGAPKLELHQAQLADDLSLTVLEITPTAIDSQATSDRNEPQTSDRACRHG